MAEEKLLPADALQKNVPRFVDGDAAAPQPQRIIPPVAGFWHRAVALLIDLFLLRTVLEMTFPIFRPVALVSESSSIALAWAIIFLYFVLAMGPVGKGRTLGKAVMGLRVTTIGGELLDNKAAAIRALLYLPIVLGAKILFLLLLTIFTRLPFIYPEIFSHVLEHEDASVAFVYCILLISLPGAWGVSNIFLISLHPLKRAVHDLAAGTIVLRQAGAHNLPTLMEQVGDRLAPLQKRALIVSVVALVLLTGMNGQLVHQFIYSSGASVYVGHMRDLKSEFGEDRYTVGLRASVLEREEAALVRQGVSMDFWTAGLKGSKALGVETTTDTKLLVFEFMSPTAIGEDDNATSASLDGMLERLGEWSTKRLVEDRAPLSLKSRTSPSQEADSATSTVFQPRLVGVLFEETADLVLARRSRIVRAGIRPLKLPKGFYENELKKIEREAASAGDAATTGSTPGAAPSANVGDGSTTPPLADQPTTAPGGE